MPQGDGPRSASDQYEHIKESYEERGKSEAGRRARGATVTRNGREGEDEGAALEEG